MSFALLIICGFLVISSTFATLNPDGLKCGQQKCSTTEYCSPFDSQCRPCSAICDPKSHNHQPDLCTKDCQEYLHDQRYVLRTDLRLEGDLRDEIQKQWTLLKISLSLTCISLLAIIFVLTRTLVKWKKVKTFAQKTFRKKWLKVTKHTNKVRDDVEVGVPKQNGLKLTMPTISQSVSASERMSNEDGTPSTTSTDLSKNNASEDNFLGYAYDNLAMTNSPETSQTRHKRESSL
ncbi:protein grindelwald [Belonocnema kinseyi]|uniref:protein grindelwald n=1 Tax=Belonocnema kinseyi TaxID=2817044 RepID=UPI00143DAAAD|nr:protein grindelwald [Belonocnema kinseyi]XP_033223974.1 protein grindelwald [Belonocnema kinseyi]